MKTRGKKTKQDDGVWQSAFTNSTADNRDGNGNEKKNEEQNER